jgi:hypothetical protein
MTTQRFASSGRVVFVGGESLARVSFCVTGECVSGKSNSSRKTRVMAQSSSAAEAARKRSSLCRTSRQKPGQAPVRLPSRRGGLLANRPVPGRKRPSHVRGDSINRTLYDLGKVRDTRSLEVDCKWGIGSNQPPQPIRPKGAPLEV